MVEAGTIGADEAATLLALQTPATFTGRVHNDAQVIGLLCGHVHWPVSREWAGTQARIMPSVAVDVRNGVDEDEVGGRPLYLLHRLCRANGLVTRTQTA